MGELFRRFGDYYRELTVSFETRFLGLDLSSVIVVFFIIGLILALYGTTLLKLTRTGKKIKALETRFDSFKEEVGLSIASIKVIASSPRAATESIIDNMISRGRSVPKEVLREGAESVERSRENLESEENTKGGEVTSERNAKEGSQNESKIKSKERGLEIDKLMEGLEDVSNPFYKERKDDADSVSMSSSSRQNTGEVVYSQKDARVGWDDKTALKDEDGKPLVTAKRMPVAPDAAVGGTLKLGGESPTGISDGEEVPEPSMRQEEISIQIEDEPLRTVDADGKLEERRVSGRVEQKVDLELVYGDFSDFIKECSVNISRGGMFVKAPNVYPIGTGIKLQVRLKDGYRLLNVEGEVIRVEEEPGEKGMGIRFVSFDKESELLIDKIVEQHNG